MYEYDLTFPGLALGTHQIPWDLKILFFRGAASMPRKEAMQEIFKYSLDESLEKRILLIRAFHEAIESLVSKGRSRALIVSRLEILWKFYSWADERYAEIVEKNVVDIFKSWAEYQIHRFKVKKEISEMYAYRQVSKIANLVASALKLPGARPAAHLLLQTRIRRPPAKKRVLSTQADKQNLAETFEFGHVLKRICDTLDLSTVRGSLPIFIKIDDDRSIISAGSLLHPYMDISLIKDNTVRRTAERARAPMDKNESILDRHKRSGILNLRIESELLIFIAQTGMNLAQAVRFKREDYRWKSNGEDLEVFRVYKGRRTGEAIFRCYRSYQDHLKRYLEWLDEVGFSDSDMRLFPIQSRSIIRAADQKVYFSAVKKAFKDIEFQFIGPKQLRKTRVNWLLRRSNNLELTAEQAAHDKEVLLRDYERPHHQSAASEIVRFHASTDLAYTPPGPGICIDKESAPESVNDIAKEAPTPDCINPEGCLFCTKHRDVMSPDYCWKLASHAKIKSLETNLYKPSEKQDLHPAYRVIERINKKLETIASGSEIRAMWVKESQDLIRAGRYHPHWRGHIELMEVIA